MSTKHPSHRDTLNVTLSPSHLAYLKYRKVQDMASASEVIRNMLDREIERELKRPAVFEDIAGFERQAQELFERRMEAHRQREQALIDEAQAERHPDEPL
jgi:hypothetical protein